MKIEELAYKSNVSVQTINMYYAWAKKHPENELVKFLPSYTQQGIRQTRYWEDDAPERLLEFKAHIVKGRNGFLSDGKQSKRRITYDKE